MSVQIKEFTPSPQLQPYVELFWEGHFNTNRQEIYFQQVTPNGFVELVIHPSDYHCFLSKNNIWSYSPDYTIIGLYTRPYEVRFHDFVTVFGIRFKPEGIYNLFGIHASEFNEGYEDMELVLGLNFKEYCSELRETSDTNLKLSLTEDYLINSLNKNDKAVTYLNKAADLIRQSNKSCRIDDLPGKVYISLRQLEREFKQKIGMSPKRYLRISRLNEVNRKLNEGEIIDLTKIAFECGYTDQAHFIRDFKSLMGVNPTLFIKERNKYLVNPKLEHIISEHQD